LSVIRHLIAPGGAVYAFDASPAAELHRGKFSVAFRGTGPDRTEVFIKKVARLNPFEVSVPVDHAVLMNRPQVVEESGETYLIYPLLQGITLRQFLQDERKKIASRKVEIFSMLGRIIEGLGVLHKSGWYHGDLNPRNVFLIISEGRVVDTRLIDFGCALPFYTHPSYASTFPLIYGSPEQVLKSFDCIDARTDIYTFGLLIYELITGQKPYGHTNPELLMQMMLNAPLRSQAELPEDVWRILQHMCAKPSLRLPPGRLSAEEVRHQLMSAIDRRPSDMSEVKESLEFIRRQIWLNDCSRKWYQNLWPFKLRV
jgi:serine/threonine protein kinase